jgi:hypothetical protein
MRKGSLDALVLGEIYPCKHGIPADFITFAVRYLIPEIRVETKRFYGRLDSQEAAYPGLDYTNPNHRLRLSQFPYHRKLFAALDSLHLTTHEIHKLCRYEGTLTARQRFEAATGEKIRDTTWDDIKDPEFKPLVSVPAGQVVVVGRNVRYEVEVLSEHEEVDEDHDRIYHSEDEQDGDHRVEVEEGQGDQTQTSGNPDELLELSEDGDDHIRLTRLPTASDDVPHFSGDDEAQTRILQDPDDILHFSEDEDEVSYSVGVDLNRRLLVAAEARARGEDVVLDADWEQWLKEASERGGLLDIPGPVLSNPSSVATDMRNAPGLHASTPGNTDREAAITQSAVVEGVLFTNDNVTEE